MADDIVVSYIKKILKENGFSKKGKIFTKKLKESEVEIEIQNNSFGKHQHYINVTINFDEQVMIRENMDDRFGVWFRAESMDFKEKLNHLTALDSEFVMDNADRFLIIDKILNKDAGNIIFSWNTFEGAKKLFYQE